MERDGEEAVAIRRVVSCPSNLHMTFVVNVSLELVMLFPRSRDVSTGRSSRSEVCSRMTERLPLQVEILSMERLRNVGRWNVSCCLHDRALMEQDSSL